eukprot:9239723-Pyramimonas_sp.AAC.1
MLGPARNARTLKPEEDGRETRVRKGDPRQRIEKINLEEEGHASEAMDGKKKTGANRVRT